MYRVLLVFDSGELLNELRQLHVWGDATDFVVADIARDGVEAYHKLRNDTFDLLLTEIRITGMDGLLLLRRVKQEGLCAHVVLCSEFQDFDAARQGIIFGAFDYLVRPFEDSQLVAVFNRIKNENVYHVAMDDIYTERILERIFKQDEDVYDYVRRVANHIYEDATGFPDADKRMHQIYQTVIDTVYERYEWLDLYVLQHGFYCPSGIREGVRESYQKFYMENLCRMYDIVCELYPQVAQEQIQEVVLYILNNPESDLSQKTLAESMHMNVSFLSTLFGVHTDLHFVSYLTNVRVRRAAYLLEHTNFKVSDIAARLQYKDAAYFSKLFKKKYGMTPTEYKSWNNSPDYQI